MVRQYGCREKKKKKKQGCHHGLPAGEGCVLTVQTVQMQTVLFYMTHSE